MDTNVLIQSIVNGLMDGWIYILVALGLTLVLSIMGIFQLAHGEIYMLGAYCTYYFCTVLGLHFLLGLIISAIVIGGLGIGLEKLFLRPFRRKGQFTRSVIIMTGLILILQTTAVVSFGTSTKIVTTPFPGVISAGGVTLSIERLVIIIVGVVFVGALFYLIKWTKIGQAMVAISQNLDGAALQGINVDHISSITMFLGCALAAVAGSLMGAIFSISPFMGSFALMKGIAVIILGGLGSITGAVVGGLILGLIDGIVPPFASTQLASIIGFIAIILILQFKPQGLMGHSGAQ